MKAILVSAVLFCASLTQGVRLFHLLGLRREVDGPTPTNVQHMAVAIWVLMLHCHVGAGRNRRL